MAKVLYQLPLVNVPLNATRSNLTRNTEMAYASQQVQDSSINPLTVIHQL